MKKPEKSIRRRIAKAKRALKRSKRNARTFRKIAKARNNARIGRARAEHRRFNEHLNNLFGR